MIKIMLIRHGETEWNKEEIFRGRADVELNGTGLKQAQLLAQYLTGEKIDVIYSSPLKRAFKTAEEIPRYHNIPVNAAPELNDFNYGEWQGLSQETVRIKYQTSCNQWQANPHLAKIPHGESLEEVKERSLSLISKVIAGSQNTVAMVSHRVINKVLICALLGLDNSHFWDIKMDTCGITVFIYENGRFVLDKHNDTSFLKPLGKHALNDF
jgi:phosphoserine phosphatase